MTTKTRTYRCTETHRANEIGGAIRIVRTETLTAVDGGLLVTVHVTGVSESERIDQRRTDFYPGVTMTAASAYRIRQGYTAVAA